MSTSTSTSLVRKLIVSVALSILYGAISVSLDPRYADFITEQDFGDIRPAIFFPAIVGILAGPIVGAVTAGFGNLIYDTVTNVFLDPYEPLEIDNLVGFVGNLIGGFVVGTFANPYRNASELFELTHEETGKFSSYFNFSFLRRLFRNTLAAIIGMGLVTGLIIGYGLRFEAGFDPELSFVVFTSIAYWNGIFLISAIPIIYLAISLLDWYQEVREEIRLGRRRNMDIYTSQELPFAFVQATSPKGDELWNLQWGAIELVIRNTDTKPHNYEVRIASNDIFSPHRHSTPLLRPAEEDELYFNVYGISPGEKQSKIYVRVDQELVEREVEFPYIMGSSNKLIFDKIMGILLIIAFGVSSLLILLNIRDNLTLTTETILALVALPVEIVVVLLLYFVWNNRATKLLFQSMGMRRDDKEQQNLMSEVIDEEQSDTYLRKIRRQRRISTLFLLFTLIVFVGISIIVIAEVNGNQIYSNDFVIIITAILLVLFLISDYFLGQAKRVERLILNKRELESKVIRRAITEAKPEIFSPNVIYMRLFNPFDTRGMRIYFHSIDNITPQELLIEDVGPKELTNVEINYTPLNDGSRNIGVEVVQFTDSSGEIIPQEKAITFDQETIRLKVTSAKVLGLNQSQIGILRGLIAGIGSISIAVAFVSELLGYTIDSRFLETTLPLIIILQSPVVWLVLTLQDRLKTSLRSE